MAQDFKEAFGYGESEHYINQVDVNGVCLTVAKALQKRVAELDERVTALEQAIHRRIG